MPFLLVGNAIAGLVFWHKHLVEERAPGNFCHSVSLHFLFSFLLSLQIQRNMTTKIIHALALDHCGKIIYHHQVVQLERTPSPLLLGLFGDTDRQRGKLEAALPLHFHRCHLQWEFINHRQSTPASLSMQEKSRKADERNSCPLSCLT